MIIMLYGHSGLVKKKRVQFTSTGPIGRVSLFLQILSKKVKFTAGNSALSILIIILKMRPAHLIKNDVKVKRLPTDV